ncbi:hypothetical protein DdX_21745 [Ditylenchus destructor]|uniref:Uncharacterized protein n=1 Tax=Ditylenchus destructor TaxID=166010 RepID=A0AAD4MF27_9BILA|nr:hypothetical protein DdX_21745 [Ditylenchus destructor]
MCGVNTEDEEVTSKFDFADEKFSDDELQTFDGLMTVEVMTADPFAAAASHILKYDGNPTQLFSLFEEQFKDTLGLITTALTETQKLNRQTNSGNDDNDDNMSDQ